MFRRILLPVDLTDRHGRAVDIAGEMAGQSGGDVTLLHVIEMIAGLSMDEERDFYGRLERAAEGHLDRLGQHLEQRQLPWRTLVRYGNRAQESVRCAAETAVDLIILTAPRLDPAVPSAGWGSMSYRIGILSQCPVLLVK